MAVLSDADRAIASRVLASRLFLGGAITAIYHLDHIRAAVNAIDDMLNAQANTLTQNQTILQNLNNTLPAPFSGSTLAQKAMAVATVAEKIGGII